MTQKELLYVEDSIMHEKNIISIIEDTKNRLEDENLIDFFDQELNVHTTLMDNLINELEAKANEWWTFDE